MKTAIRCVEFEDILGTENVFALVGLTSFRNKYFGICSRAFFKLETISSRLQTASDEIETLVSQRTSIVKFGDNQAGLIIRLFQMIDPRRLSIYLLKTVRKIRIQYLNVTYLV